MNCGTPRNLWPAGWASAKGQAIAVPSQQHREWMKEFQAEEQDSGMESDSMPADSLIKKLWQRKFYARTIIY